MTVICLQTPLFAAIPTFLFYSLVPLSSLWLHFKAAFNHYCTVCGILGCATSPLICVEKKKKKKETFSTGFMLGLECSILAEVTEMGIDDL